VLSVAAVAARNDEGSAASSMESDLTTTTCLLPPSPSILPQKFPFLFLDEVTSLSSLTTTTAAAASAASLSKVDSSSSSAQRDSDSDSNRVRDEQGRKADSSSSSSSSSAQRDSDSNRARRDEQRGRRRNTDLRKATGKLVLKGAHRLALFEGHAFQGKAILPGVLQIEALAQLANVILLSTSSVSSSASFSASKETTGVKMDGRDADEIDDGTTALYYYLFASVDNVKWKRSVHPGDTFEMEVEVFLERMLPPPAIRTKKKKKNDDDDDDGEEGEDDVGRSTSNTRGIAKAITKKKKNDDDGDDGEEGEDDVGSGASNTRGIAKARGKGFVNGQLAVEIGCMTFALVSGAGE
jgi:3-hydroxymyristoyl/3-hydroxydecanoyl-(acyl carrier protein) dehydratase